MEIYSVDSTESQEKQKKIQEQNIALSEIRSQVLWLSSSALYHSATPTCADSQRNLNPYSHALLTPTKSAKSKNQ